MRCICAVRFFRLFLDAYYWARSKGRCRVAGGSRVWRRLASGVMSNMLCNWKCFIETCPTKTWTQTKENNKGKCSFFLVTIVLANSKQVYSFFMLQKFNSQPFFFFFWGIGFPAPPPWKKNGKLDHSFLSVPPLPGLITGPKKMSCLFDMQTMLVCSELLV